MDYTCSPSCINATEICQQAKYGMFEQSHLENSSTLVSTVPQFYLTINDLPHLDFCRFSTKFEYTTEFCDKFWEGFPPVMVPDFVKQLYPQFITIPMTYKINDKDRKWIDDSKCSKLWAEGEKISF